MEPKDVENLVIEYVIDMKRKIDLKAFGPNAVPQRMSPIFLFLTQNDILINIKKIKKMFPRRVKTKGELPYTIEDIQKMMESTSNYRNKAIISFYASTGVRFAAILELKMKDLKDMGEGCMSVLIYKDDIEEYPVFLIPEAVNNLKKYFAQRESNGEKLTEDSPVFRNSYRRKLAWKDVKPINENSLKQAMCDILAASQIRKALINSGEKHQKSMFNAFRKFFETTLNNITEVNSNITEKLMGHRNDLRGTYYNPTLEVRFETFKIAIPALTISDKNRDSLKIKNLQEDTDDVRLLRQENKTILLQLSNMRKAFSQITEVSIDHKSDVESNKIVDELNKIQNRLNSLS